MNNLKWQKEKEEDIQSCFNKLLKLHEIHCKGMNDNKFTLGGDRGRV